MELVVKKMFEDNLFNFLLLIILLHIFQPVYSSADTIILNNGAEIQCDEIFQENDLIRCRRFGGVVIYPKNIIAKINRKISDKATTLEKQNESSISDPFKSKNSEKLPIHHYADATIKNEKNIGIKDDYSKRYLYNDVWYIILIFLFFIIWAIVAYLIDNRKRYKFEARMRAIELSDIDNMDGIAFEHYVAHLLKNKGYIDVKVTKGSGDFGVDITALKGEKRYAIQVKRTSGKVSRRAISDAIAGKDHYSCNAAMVITNSYLSRSAEEFSKSVKCDVVDRDKIIDWIQSYQISNPNKLRPRYPDFSVAV